MRFAKSLHTSLYAPISVSGSLFLEPQGVSQLSETPAFTFQMQCLLATICVVLFSASFMFLTKSSSYVLSSTYSGQKDNIVMCLQEVLKKRWIISLQSAEAYDLRRREIGKRKKGKL